MNLLPILQAVASGALSVQQADLEINSIISKEINQTNFVVAYKEDGSDTVLYWRTRAKDRVEAVDLFWKSHDVLCELVSVGDSNSLGIN